ncbi:hypothetical protein MMC10_004483 [Thelotrema lepadinum]|nr:hypothetical protein [Thelotrema lepadinum]
MSSSVKADTAGNMKGEPLRLTPNSPKSPVKQHTKSASANMDAAVEDSKGGSPKSRVSVTRDTTEQSNSGMKGSEVEPVVGASGNETGSVHGDGETKPAEGIGKPGPKYLPLT